MAEEKKVNVETEETEVKDNDAVEVELTEDATSGETEVVEKKKLGIPKWLVTTGKIAEGVAAAFGAIVAVFLIKDSIDTRKRKNYIEAQPQQQAIPTMQSIINDPVEAGVDIAD